MVNTLDKDELNSLVERVVAGERKAIARTLRWVDDAPAQGRRLAAALHPHITHTQVVGITGNPGAGKSTVVDRFVTELRADNKTVAVLAVDPSSPFSGGAILGDRIRMSQHAIDDAFQVGRNIQTERRNLDGLLFQVGAELLDRRAAGKGRQAGQQVVQGAAQAVDGAAATSRGF